MTLKINLWVVKTSRSVFNIFGVIVIRSDRVVRRVCIIVCLLLIMIIIKKKRKKKHRRTYNTHKSVCGQRLWVPNAMFWHGNFSLIERTKALEEGSIYSHPNGNSVSNAVENTHCSDYYTPPVSLCLRIMVASAVQM